MSTRFVSKRNNEMPLGSIDAKKSAKTTQMSIERLKQKLTPMDQQDKALDNIDAVVGRPTEKLIPRELLEPAPKEWDCFQKASEDKIKQMSQSIKTYGLLHNITVWKQPTGKYMILGGHTRTSCFDYLYETEHDEKWRQIPALAYDAEQLTETDAHRIFIVSNTDQRDISQKSKATAYKELMILEKKKSFYGSFISSRKAAATQANVSESTLNTYLGLLDLIQPFLDMVDDETLTVRTGYHISRMPKNLQQYIYDNQLYKGLTTQAARQLKQAATTNEIDAILNRINSAQKYYKYRIETRNPKPANMEIVPMFMEKSHKDEFIDRYIQAVKESSFAGDLKKTLIDTMEQARKN